MDENKLKLKNAYVHVVSKQSECEGLRNLIATLHVVANIFVKVNYLFVIEPLLYLSIIQKSNCSESIRLFLCFLGEFISILR